MIRDVSLHGNERLVRYLASTCAGQRLIHAPRVLPKASLRHSRCLCLRKKKFHLPIHQATVARMSGSWFTVSGICSKSRAPYVQKWIPSPPGFVKDAFPACGGMPGPNPVIICHITCWVGNPRQSQKRLLSSRRTHMGCLI